MIHKKPLFAFLFMFPVAAAAACGNNNGGNVPGDTVAVSGMVFTLSSGGQDVYPASDATVTASVDFNGDGAIGEEERVTTQTDADGKYTLDCPAEAGRRVVVTFELEGYAKAIKTFDVQSLGSVAIDATLAEMKSLTCQNVSCSDDSGTVQIQGIEVASGYAQVFNPVTDADKFPGGFADDQGNMLVSAVFAAFDLYDADDEKIETLEGGQTASVRLKTPRDTWSVVTDLQPGNGRIDVPMYYFDEAAGEWVSQGTGWLENGIGEVVTEDQLDSIRDDSYADVLFSVFEAGHFSYWNVDWPVDTHACITGRVVDASGSPVSGAKVTIQGISYSGTSTPQMTDSAGGFCVDVMRSEAPGEDVNNNGVAGETQQVLATVSSGGKIYRFGVTDVPAAQSSCPAGCLDLGDLDLTPGNEVQVTLCTVSGTVYLDGAPVESVLVYADDEYLDPEARDAVCTYEAGCTGADSTDASGQYSFTSAFATIFKVGAIHTTDDGTVTVYYDAARTYLQCPSDPVDLRLEAWACIGDVLQISYAGGSIDWTPAVAVQFIIVADADGNPKWYILSEEGSIQPPVAYGEVPSGAVQLFPYDVPAPSAVASGDTITIFPPSGLVPYNGMMCHSTSVYTVP